MVKVTYPERVKRKSKIKDFSRRDLREKFFYYKPIIHQTTFFKKKLFDKYGLYDTSYKVCADHDFYARVITDGVRFTFAPICVTVFSEDGISAQMLGSRQMNEERERVRRKNFSPGYRLKRKVVDCIEGILKINQL